MKILVISKNSVWTNKLMRLLKKEDYNSKIYNINVEIGNKTNDING